MLVIIDLTVVGEHQRPPHHRLVAALGQILDGQPAVSQYRARPAPDAIAVGSPVAQTLRHELDCFDSRARSDDAVYAAHGRQSSATPGLRNVPLDNVSLAIGRRFV